MGSTEKLKTYQEFWPFYLREHASKKNRSVHFIGTTLVFVILFAALINGAYAWLWLMPVAGYAFAWFGHFRIEGNRPATFTYPFWSLYSDFRMYFLFLFGRLDSELTKAGVSKNT